MYEEGERTPHDSPEHLIPLETAPKQQSHRAGITQPFRHPHGTSIPVRTEEREWRQGRRIVTAGVGSSRFVAVEPERGRYEGEQSVEWEGGYGRG